MTTKANLVMALRQKVQHLYSAYQQEGEKKIYAKFDRTLFSESFASLQSYFDEIEQTLQKLEQLDEQQPQQLTYLADKLVAQCRALHDALTNRTYYSSIMPKVGISTNGNADKMRIHQLPPKQRLEKYYEALNKLNDKLDWQVSLREEANSEQERQYYQQQIDITQQRKQRCCDAIELLEEYLSYTN